MTHSRHGKEIAQLVAVRMLTWQWISEGGGAMREGDFDEDVMPKLYTQ
jgi:hypothetical protein